MGDPPVAGAVHRTVAEVGPAAAATPMIGAPGAVAAAAGVTTLDDAEKALVPMALMAATWNVTGVPLTSPVTTRLVAPATAGRMAPSCTLAALSTFTEYPVIADPPLAGAVQVTVA